MALIFPAHTNNIYSNIEIMFKCFVSCTLTFLCYCPILKILLANNISFTFLQFILLPVLLFTYAEISHSVIIFMKLKSCTDTPLHR